VARGRFVCHPIGNTSGGTGTLCLPPYWEHFGMLDNNECVMAMEKKIFSYIKNDILPWNNLLISYESQKYPFDVRLVMRMIKYFILS